MPLPGTQKVQAPKGGGLVAKLQASKAGRAPSPADSSANAEGKKPAPNGGGMVANMQASKGPGTAARSAVSSLGMSSPGGGVSSSNVKGEKPPVFPSYKGFASEAASAVKRKIQMHAATFHGVAHSRVPSSGRSSPSLGEGEDDKLGASVYIAPGGSILQDGEGSSHLQVVTTCCFNTDANLCATGGAEGVVTVWGVKEEKPRHKIEMVKEQQKRISALDINSAGKYVLVGDWGYRVKVFDLGQGLELMAMAGHEGKVTCGRFEGQSRMLATGGEDKVVRVWDPRDHKGKAMKFKAPDEVLDLSFSPDGTGLLFANKSNDMWFYDSRKNEAPLHKYEGHTDWVNCCTYDADGKHILSGSQDRTARLWDAATASLVQEYPHKESVNSVRFFGHSTVITAQGNRYFKSKTNSMVLWKRKEADIMCEVEGHTDAILQMDVHAATRQIVSASMDRTARLWQLPEGGKNKRGKQPKPRMCMFGCGYLAMEDAMKEHEEGCLMRDVKCEACGIDVEAGRLEAHGKDECQERKVTCECGEVVVAKGMEAHSKDGCLIVKIKCDLCSGMVTKADEKDHKANSCPQRRVDCALGCGKRFNASHVFKHEASECPHRQETCADCDEVIEHCKMEQHRERQCVSRLISCRKCGLEFKFMAAFKHDANECPKRGVPCSLCSQAVPLDEHEQHKVETCIKRIVPCEHLLRGCFEKVPFDELEAHVAQCPFVPPPEGEASEEQVEAPEAEVGEAEITNCVKCTFTLKPCPKCDEKFCAKCMTQSGLPNKGLCKTCTRRAILGDRKTWKSSAEVKMRF